MGVVGHGKRQAGEWTTQLSILAITSIPSQKLRVAQQDGPFAADRKLSAVGARAAAPLLKTTMPSSASRSPDGGGAGGVLDWL